MAEAELRSIREDSLFVSEKLTSIGNVDVPANASLDEEKKSQKRNEDERVDSIFLDH